MRRIIALLNARAGTLIDNGPERIRAELETALAARAQEVSVHLLKPRDMPRAIDQAARGEHDAVIVGGGDGSVSIAAAALSGSAKTLGVLPFGTINLLATDLGMPSEPHAAIAALAHAAPRQIDLASVNGRPFHSLSGLGFFSQMARAREETRGHPLGRLVGVGLAAMLAINRTTRFALEVSADGTRVHLDALAVLVTNNVFGPDWRRERLDGGVLEMHVAEDMTALGLLKASADLLSGAWRANPGIRSIVAREVTIDKLRRRTWDVRRRAWAATDGELTREHVPLRYAILPRSLTVLALR